MTHFNLETVNPVTKTFVWSKKRVKNAKSSCLRYFRPLRLKETSTKWQQIGRDEEKNKIEKKWLHFSNWVSKNLRINLTCTQMTFVCTDFFEVRVGCLNLHHSKLCDSALAQTTVRSDHSINRNKKNEKKTHKSSAQPLLSWRESAWSAMLVSLQRTEPHLCTSTAWLWKRWLPLHNVKVGWCVRDPYILCAVSNVKKKTEFR